MIARLDGGYLSWEESDALSRLGEILNTLLDMGLQLCMSCRYDWVVSQGRERCTIAFKGVRVEESDWLRIDETTRLMDVGHSPVISTCKHPFRVVLVEKKQTP